MNISVQVNAVIDHTSGVFVPKEEIEEQVAEALESADYGSWSVGESEYETTEWEVEVKS